MKALVLSRFGRLDVEERDDPVPAADEVLIRIIATGICGSDLHGFTGENGRRVPGQIMGHESVGRIEALGKDVDDSLLTVGRTVTFNPVIIPLEDVDRFRGREQHSPHKMVVGVAPDFVSSFAQFVALPARNVVPLPDDMPAVRGALVEPLAVALHAVRRIGISAGDRVAVIGGGPIGQSAVLALALTGVDSVIVSEIEPRRRALVESLGATPIDPSAAPAVDQVERIFGGLADAAIDAVGSGPTLSDALSVTTQSGSVALVGMGSPSLSFESYSVSTQERSIVGCFTYSAQDFRDAAAWISSAPASVDQLISREVPLAEAPRAFESLAGGDGTAGKILVRLDEDPVAGGQPS